MTRINRDIFADDRIAHSSLKGQVTAPEYTNGTQLRVQTPVADLRLDPTRNSVDRQILFGHPVTQLENTRGLSQDTTTGYVGYVSPDTLAPTSPPTHRVIARSTFLFDQPDFKSPNPHALSCGSLLHITDISHIYATTQCGRYTIASHLSPIDQTHPDLAATAYDLLGTPYLWGGNSSFGIDCSGLVQLAAQAAGFPCQGDSDQQMANFGQHLPLGSPPKRNDLMFWKGHVALVFDDHTLIHANACHMAVALEPIDAALKRIQAQENSTCIAHKRL